MTDDRETAPSHDQRRDHGLAAYAKIFAVPEEQVPAEFTDRVGPVFAEEALQAAGGAWTSPALTPRERSVAVLTALTAQGLSGDRLRTHLDLARLHGHDDDSLTALMVLLAGYLGYPRASVAMEAVHTTTSSGTTAVAPGRPAAT